MIDIGGVRLHADVMEPPNASAPPVIFEAGIAATSLSWRLAQKEIAKFAPTLSYDRAGLGWSESAAKPRDVHTLVEELRSLLKAAGLDAPRVIVAHSFGGLIALDYAARYPAEVAGLVLIDPVGVAEWANPSRSHSATLRRGIFLARCGEALARVGVVRFTLNRLASGARRMPKAIARATSGRGGEAFLTRMVGEIRKMPPELWPMVQSHWCDTKCFIAMRRYLMALPLSADAVLREATSIAAPVVVLSAGNASETQRADHERVARLSARGRVNVVEDANHWIQLDRPDVVIRAIRELARLE